MGRRAVYLDLKSRKEAAAESSKRYRKKQKEKLEEATTIQKLFHEAGIPKIVEKAKEKLTRVGEKEEELWWKEQELNMAKQNFEEEMQQTRIQNENILKVIAEEKGELKRLMAETAEREKGVDQKEKKIKKIEENLVERKQEEEMLKKELEELKTKLSKQESLGWIDFEELFQDNKKINFWLGLPSLQAFQKEFSVMEGDLDLQSFARGVPKETLRGRPSEATSKEKFVWFLVRLRTGLFSKENVHQFISIWKLIFSFESRTPI